MTICIAALCELRKKIVAISDTKISFGGDFSADDVILKMHSIAPDWVALFAGDDINEVEPIIGSARAKLAGGASCAPESVASAVHDAHRERLTAQIESQVLRRFGYTLESFLQNGKSQLTEKIFEDLCDKISRVTLSPHFVVAGFDEVGRGHLFYIDGDSAPSDYTQVGFCAVGSGSSAALSSLAFHAERGFIGENAGLASSIYCCCYAKFMAESASDVGEGSFLTILERGKKDQVILGPRIDAEIRKAWEQHGAPRVPKSIVKAIPEMIFSVRDLGKDGVFDRAVGKASKRGNARITREYRALQRALRAFGEKHWNQEASQESNPTNSASDQT